MIAATSLVGCTVLAYAAVRITLAALYELTELLLKVLT
jgi:hypothetical protein